jgi:hypothetical protein
MTDADSLDAYARAWNEPRAEDRRRLLEASLTDDAELVEPRGVFTGRAAIIDRIVGFAERFPGAVVDITTAVDEHNGFARYGWQIRKADGDSMLDGIDVVERAPDGKLRRIVMFFGDLAKR